MAFQYCLVGFISLWPQRQGSTSTHDDTRWECSERELVHSQPVVGRSVATPCWTHGLGSGLEVS